MRRLTNAIPTMAAVLLLAACSAEKSENQAAAEAAADGGAPAISGAVAPGVAFRFDYAFDLPAKAISTVQEQHAAQCQKLGPSKCRVTGLNYDQRGQDEVSARMDLLLAPDVAYRFGNEAIATVERADGKVGNVSVQGNNAGDQIKLSQSDSAAIEAEVARLEARLAAKGLASAERTALTRQIEDLRGQLRGNARQRGELEQSIASTPVSFTYASKGVLSGDGSFAAAASASWTSLGAFASFLALLAGIALPWIVVAAALVAGWRLLRRRTATSSAGE